MLTIRALPISPGLAFGQLLMADAGLKPPPLCTVTDTAAELERLDGAIERAMAELSDLYYKTLENIGEEAAAIFEIHQMMLEDDDFLDTSRGIIENEYLSAENAIYNTGIQFAEMFEATGSEIMRGRAADVRDLTRRIISVLKNETEPDSLSAAGKPKIIAAEELLPSQTVKMDKSRVLAFVCRRGSKTGHAAILARCLGIPAVSDLGDDFDLLEDGNDVIVDGDEGLVIIGPDTETIIEYEKKRQLLLEETTLLNELRDLPAVTKDGLLIELYANIGHPDEVEAALSRGADGIGLFRSEFLFFSGDDFPDENEQFQAYKTVLEAMAPRRVIIRTLDFGADKQASYFNFAKEENPAMGYRAIRICLDRPDIFEPQIRALLRASIYGKLAVMFPMITGKSEVSSILTFVEKVKQNMKNEGIPYAEDVEFGIMIETPASVVMAPELAKMVDFFSVGTNDLTQYTIAVDRMNTKVDYLFDPANPAVLRQIGQAARAAHEAGIRIGICGESAADVSLLPAYIAMGIDELSMNPHSLPRIKRAIRGLSAEECRESGPEVPNACLLADFPPCFVRFP